MRRGEHGGLPHAGQSSAARRDAALRRLCPGGAALYERGNARMAAHPDWGTLIFDYEKPAVRSFLKSSAALLLREYHVDGLRVDAMSSMLYLGFGRGNDFVRNRLGGDTDLGAISLLRELCAPSAATSRPSRSCRA